MKNIKAILSKLSLYQKGLIAGFSISITFLIANHLGPKLFHLAHMGYCSAGSVFLLFAWAMSLSPYIDSAFQLLLWPLIGISLGTVLHFTQHKEKLFFVFKWVIGLIPLLPGTIWLLLAILETSRIVFASIRDILVTSSNIFVSIRNIPYVLVSLLMPLLLIALGVVIINSKNKI